MYIYIYIYIKFDKWIFTKLYWSSTLLQVSCIEHSSGVHFY